MDSFYHETFNQSEQVPMQLRLHRGLLNYTILEHWHRSIEIDYLLDCDADVYVNGLKKTESAGSIILINSGDIHALDPIRVETSSGDEVHGISLFISYEFLKKICPEIDQITFELVGQEEKTEELRRIFDDLIRLELGPAEEYGYLKMNSLLHQIMYILLTYFKCRKNHLAIKSQKYIDRLRVVLDYIEENFQEALTLQGVAERFSVSMEYLARILKKYTGNTFKAHLNQVRVTRAFQELIETDYSILDIAMRSGFSDSRSFINVFRDSYGMTPSQYRKKYPRRDSAMVESARREMPVFAAAGVVGAAGAAGASAMTGAIGEAGAFAATGASAMTRAAEVVGAAAVAGASAVAGVSAAAGASAMTGASSVTRAIVVPAASATAASPASPRSAPFKSSSSRRKAFPQRTTGGNGVGSDPFAENLPHIRRRDACGPNG